MNRNVYVGDKMYAIFCFYRGKEKVSYVQPCKILELSKDGFLAECHNSINGSGKEFFSFDDIGKGIYFSKDSAEVNINN